MSTLLKVFFWLHINSVSLISPKSRHAKFNDEQLNFVNIYFSPPYMAFWVAEIIVNLLSNLAVPRSNPGDFYMSFFFLIAFDSGEIWKFMISGIHSFQIVYFVGEIVFNKSYLVKVTTRGRWVDGNSKKYQRSFRISNIWYLI